MKITGHKKLATLQKYIKSDSDIQMMLKVWNSIGKTIKWDYLFQNVLNRIVSLWGQ
jgi:hypothetical protein